MSQFFQSKKKCTVLFSEEICSYSTLLLNGYVNNQNCEQRLHSSAVQVKISQVNYSSINFWR